MELKHSLKAEATAEVSEKDTGTSLKKNYSTLFARQAVLPHDGLNLKASVSPIFNAVTCMVRI